LLCIGGKVRERGGTSTLQNGHERPETKENPLKFREKK